MNNSFELQAKVILERISQTEKNTRAIAEGLTSLSRKESK